MNPFWQKSTVVLFLNSQNVFNKKEEIQVYYIRLNNTNSELEQNVEGW